MRAEDSLGLYISIPFCRAKCTFCNFASGVSSSAQIARYVEVLCAEIDSSAETATAMGAEPVFAVDTLYFGGGTPSLLEPAQLATIFEAVGRIYVLSPAPEVTLEAAPDQISTEVLRAAQSLGVNRISLGVQSFVNRESAAVGRTHTANSCLAEIHRLRDAGIAEVAIDLIAGLPYQTQASWQQSLELAAASGATHISVYMLEVDEDSRLGLEILNNGRRLHAPATPCAELSADLYEQACEYLQGHGFPQYEISNFATPAHQSRHNRKYWERSPYFGFGADAHSMLRAENGAVRFANPDDLKLYMHSPCNRIVTRIDAQFALEESLFLGLRLCEGVSIARLREAFGYASVEAVARAARELIDHGLLLEQDGHWRLTPRGRLISNDVFAHLLAAPEQILTTH